MEASQSSKKKSGTHDTTWFASPRRARRAELVRQIGLITSNPLVDALLSSVSGLLAVLNEDRQILAVNDGFLTSLGGGAPEKLLGLRMGEALECVHAADHENGCGTGKYCSGCGIVQAITASLATGSPAERRCALTTAQDNLSKDYCLNVKSSPFFIDGTRFVLLFIQDTTEEEHRSALERTFLHDINNTITGLGYTVELMSRLDGSESSKLHDRLRRISATLSREVRIQSAIRSSAGSDFQLPVVHVSSSQVVEEVNAVVSSHPAVLGKSVTVTGPDQPLTLYTDPPLLSRVLTNMLINALEATEEGGEVRFSVEDDGECVVFRTWNRQAMPEQVALRIFQRFFSTKQQPGRGFGTFSMKLFGEKFLGGTVDFVTSEERGTIFSLTLPKGGRLGRSVDGDIEQGA